MEGASMKSIDARVLEAVEDHRLEASVPVTLEATLESLGYDSLELAALVGTLEIEFNISITDETAAAWGKGTVADVLASIRNRLS